MMPTIFDHLIALLLVVVWPLWSAYYGRDGVRELAADPSWRLRGYITTITWQWVHVACIIALWIVTARSWSELGLGFVHGTGFYVTLGLTALITWQLWSQWRRTQVDPTLAEKLREQLAELESFLPRTEREVRTMRALAVTAGICEEIACRGFLLWYLAHWLPMPVAVALMAIAFGASHLYQGPKAAAQIGGIGIIAALLYLGSGSLWIPIVLHILLDLNQIAIARIALAAKERESVTAIAEGTV